MNNKFSENLKKIRKDNNLSQEQLADKLGVSRQAISKWESAVAYPEMDKIITLCDKFNLNIDDLLHKDIREEKGEEESKKKINKFIDDFLNFITNSINLFSNMRFKSKCKCLFEQTIICLVLFIIFIIIGSIGQNLLSSLFNILPNKIYFAIYSLFSFVYTLFAIVCSIVIVVHIFKTRYLDYYQKFTENLRLDNLDVENNEIEEKQKDSKNKEFLKENEDKIIIRDPKHSEYKFINGLSKFIISFIKFFVFCFAIIMFITLICVSSLFIISFLTYKTGFFFIGLLVTLFSIAIINIILIVLLLNFVFNRKNSKKKMIWLFITSLVMLGIGTGFIAIGTLDFEYIENNNKYLKTEYIEIDMNDDLLFNIYPKVEYIENNNDNIKLEYSINKYAKISHSNLTGPVVYIWSDIANPLKLLKDIVDDFNNKKIVAISTELQNVKIYTSKENIKILKNNYQNYYDEIDEKDNLINTYENKINDLEIQISNLKDQLAMYENNSE